MTKTIGTLLMISIGATFSVAADATLIDRGNGMVYDTDTNLTWLQNWNTNGLMDWNTAMSWADQLQYGGYSDWRLPIYTDPSNEMYHVWHDELGNIINNPTTNRGPFLIPQFGDYWLGTIYRSGEAFTFTLSGNQSNGVFSQLHYATAVRVGDVPEPATVVQLLAGLALIGALAFTRPRTEA